MKRSALSAAVLAGREMDDPLDVVRPREVVRVLRCGDDDGLDGGGAAAFSIRRSSTGCRSAL
jgi:hypothetical protein